MKCTDRILISGGAFHQDKFHSGSDFTQIRRDLHEYALYLCKTGLGKYKIQPDPPVVIPSIHRMR
ncbi:hypothetical protein Lal_00034949 [Lupinus albus]|nr:hypothetical protein Lal_00034949 [Lupinus albus]